MSSAPITVRRASSKDLARLLHLYGQLSPGALLPERDTAESQLGAILSREGMHLLVADSGDEVVGTVTLVIVPNLTHGGRAWAQVENMVVEEGWRGSGAGRALLDGCWALAAEAGCYKLQLQSANGREGAHRFYERYGFSASSRGYRLYLE